MLTNKPLSLVKNFVEGQSKGIEIMSETTDSTYCAVWQDGEYMLVGEDDKENLYLCKYCFSFRASGMFYYQFLFSILLMNISKKNYRTTNCDALILLLLIAMLVWEVSFVFVGRQEGCDNVARTFGDKILPGLDIVHCLYWVLVLLVNFMHLMFVKNKMWEAATTGGAGTQDGEDDALTVANTVNITNEGGDTGV